MAHISKEELLHLAKLSALTFDEKEISYFSDQITSILNYVDQIKKLAPTQQHAIKPTLVNVLREDVAQPFQSEKILAQAPMVDETYFAVPKILDEK